MFVDYLLMRLLKKELEKMVNKAVDDKISPQLDELNQRIAKITENFSAFQSKVVEYFAEFKQITAELERKVGDAVSQAELQVKIDQLKESVANAENEISKANPTQFDPTPDQPTV